MADKAFGVKDINLIGASGTPTIESPNNLNINAVNVAISTDITVAGKVSLGAGTSISSPAANTLTLGTNSVERVRIDSSGNIGIGTDNPEPYGPSVHIAGVDPALLIEETESAVDYFCVNVSNGNVNMWYDDSADIVLKTATAFGGQGSVERLRITSGGNLKFPSGNGIDFSATGGPDSGTGSSELLDDYEEGTYSPAWQHATNVNYTAQNGQYIKIGRLVRVSGEFSFTTYTSFVNGWDQITLPFNGTKLNSSGSISSDWWAVVAGGTGQSAGTLNFGPLGGPGADNNLAFTNIFLTGNNGMGNASLGSIFTSSSTTKTIRFHITYTSTS